ncbi:dynein intermediate chain 2, ciliary [Contarinia nasturtii]|uniref:dynein intermediate chain 2, ciliary n=1 Tax=Contarinia nasturtii TaxID=265458 RepID=UPI0012D37BA2|nr:dynein intermediate chain 2, ciliary [Contarinia nasturtii]
MADRKAHSKTDKPKWKNTIRYTQRDGIGDKNDDYEHWLRFQKPLRPDDQLDLTEAELSEEITKHLDTEHTNYPKNLVIYSYKDYGYIPLPPPPNIGVLLNVDGNSIPCEYGEKTSEETGLIDGAHEDGESIDTKLKTTENETSSTPVEEIDNDEIIDDDDLLTKQQSNQETEKKKKLINQFNYCERAVLTLNNPPRNVETQTIPPPRSTFGSYVLQWIIYDSYAEHFEQSEREKEKERKAASAMISAQSKQFDLIKRTCKNTINEELNRNYLRCWQILERMINQNIFDEIALDYRYYEDPSDEFREEEGTLLPLWKFQYEKTKKMNVTDICFNTMYYDLFAVCFGCFDFMKQLPEGLVCLFTIKNPSYPEYIITTESGVMCCDIHQKFPYLLVIGMFDGNVAVYNLQSNPSQAMYMSRGTDGKHSNIVWEVKWGIDMQDGELNFYSISNDGIIYNWVLMQSQLSSTIIATLFMDQEISAAPDGHSVKLKAAGTCMTFHPKLSNIFLAGSEEGDIFKCSTEFSSRYLMCYNAHYLPVYNIDYNKFNSNIFVSCAADWRVKIWEDMRSEPLFIFDLGASVGDVKWAPYSSTVLAALTTDGKVFVFDINVNKYKPICVQQVVPRKSVRLTRIAFNKKIPFIIVGDEK